MFFALKDSSSQDRLTLSIHEYEVLKCMYRYESLSLVLEEADLKKLFVCSNPSDPIQKQPTQIFFWDLVENNSNLVKMQENIRFLKKHFAYLSSLGYCKQTIYFGWPDQ